MHNSKKQAFARYKMKNFTLRWTKDTDSLDYPELLLCMALSHIVAGNPFFGASLFLFAGLVRTLFLNRRLVTGNGGGDHYLYYFGLTAILSLGLSLAIFFPGYISRPQANAVTLFIVLLMIRDLLCSIPRKKGKGKVWYWLFIAYSQIRLDLFCIFLIVKFTSGADTWVLSAVTVLTGLSFLLFPTEYIDTPVKERGPSLQKEAGFHSRVSSYRIFTNMRLYASAALSIGILMFFCNILMSGRGPFELRTYGNLLGWFAGIALAVSLTRRFLVRHPSANGLGIFITGGVIWILGAIFMFRVNSSIKAMFWMLVWGIGVALITTAIRQFYDDFNAVAELEPQGGDPAEVEVSNAITSTVVTAISSSVMLIVMALWTFLIPELSEYAILPLALRICMMQLPVAFMIVAVVFALNQPLDGRTKEKLTVFRANNPDDGQVRESLRKQLVGKYRKRFGVKLLCSMVSPFLHLKVRGVEKLRKESYPSVFVCNHGFMYGPVAAVIYLPTYFRPWIHNVMLTREGAEQEIRYSFRGFLRVMGEKVGGTIIRLVTRPVCWALNSFNPIPVERGSSRAVMSTFEASVEALRSGDNILIFPERPSRRTRSGEGKSDSSHEELRGFFTGFAHLATMYHERCGKNLLFYPLYSDSRRHLFCIGDPVEYDPSLPSRESKQQIAAQLHERMTALASGKDDGESK